MLLLLLIAPEGSDSGPIPPSHVILGGAPASPATFQAAPQPHMGCAINSRIIIIIIIVLRVCVLCRQMCVLNGFRKSYSVFMLYTSICEKFYPECPFGRYPCATQLPLCCCCLYATQGYPFFG